MNTIENLSWKYFSKSYNLDTKKYGEGEIFYFPSSWKNGWIVEMHPSDGIYLASAWFTPDEDFKFLVDSKEKSLWLLCIDSGPIEINSQGSKSKSLGSNMQMIYNMGKPFTVNFKKGEHYCFTSVLLSETYMHSLVKDAKKPPKISLSDSVKWKTDHIDTPSIMLIMEQIRWSIRNSDMALLAYEGMTLHLLCAIDRNFPKIPNRRASRRHYVTWENEQKLFKVKASIDEDILNTPSIESLCRLAEMSETKLREGFKNIYNITIYAYIRRETMKKAMQLLSSDHLSIKNISEICGFKNPSKFSAAFKDIHGISPSDFRKSFNL